MPSVLMIGSEALPFSKTGGLADVLGALPSALARLGWTVTVVVPRYRGVTGGRLVDRFTMAVGGVPCQVGCYEAALDDGARAILVDVPELFDRDGLYVTPEGHDFPDNPRRFAVLVRAALDFAVRERARPTVVHAHDWQAGLAPVYLRTLFARDPVLGNLPSVLTIHNLAYQGNFEPDWAQRLDLPAEVLHMQRMEFWGRMSFLKGGITDADIVTTVSPTYAREIQTPEFGCGLEGVLRHRAGDVVGILNGIDAARWDPATDPALAVPFSAASLSGKRANKAAVLGEYGLPADAAALDRPLVGMISRMVDQKGLDLIAAVEDRLLALDAAFVVLGTGDARYQDFWRRLAARAPNRVAVRVGFDEALAHRIEAGADLFMMPSRFEPCGLNQMYSLRYGTVPVVRAVGGLADTVREGVNGFVFHDYSPAAFIETLERALSAHRDPRRWRTIQAAGMAADHSWDHSAREYVKIYERAAEARFRSLKETHGS